MGFVLLIFVSPAKYLTYGKNSNFFFLKTDLSDFPGGRVDKNPTANAGDEVSVPGLGRFHILGSS